ncbi:orf100d (mitochondrion) [Beta vulgaris subsp. vulgaris]|uniref:Orf100b protein n=1 Tax=Beta vulgaris subsp. vulgaris TaxID=3555 RepID=Q9MDV6_BETVV|nr:orf100b [Beta vulgaris subsp. vulgaris]NP_064054.1 orf100d [Beta vulgaris subsp. vulgaris]BAA99334.1 orf100b [Beta vulgaris subsp. vulgaris]BAA99446.1 orf100d [Beta vulgaris subsp. vulgaris]
MYRHSETNRLRGPSLMGHGPENSPRYPPIFLMNASHKKRRLCFIRHSARSSERYNRANSRASRGKGTTISTSFQQSRPRRRPKHLNQIQLTLPEHQLNQS